VASRVERGLGGAWRVAIVASLVTAYLVIAVLVHVSHQHNTVYIHLAYLPIVLAASWWGWRGTAVAAALAVQLLCLRFAGVGIGEPWTDGVRVFFMLLVAAVVASLFERARAAGQTCELSRENYRTLFENQLAGVWVYREGRIIIANRRLGAMLGCDASTLEGRSIWDIIHPDDRDAVAARLELRESGESPDLHYECRLLRADGGEVWVDQASSLTEYDGEPAVVVGSYDITQRKEADSSRAELSELARQQEEQLVHSTRLAELGEMAAAVAHELNQPLTGIRTFAKNAMYMVENEAGEPGELIETLGRIAEQVDRAARIIGQMRQLARRSPRQLSPFPLNAAVTEALDFLRPQLSLAGVAVETRLEPSLPEVLGDRIRLEQVFLNLLTNARQAMEDAPERVLRVETRLEAPGGPVAVVVSDTGAGFPPEAAPRIFAPFYTTKKPGHGTGLGLSISLNIVKDHEGTIEAASQPGQGATFTVRLPINTSREPDDVGKRAEETNGA
jgi:PAS domain S-box-containing protein